jgi:NTE family protein
MVTAVVLSGGGSLGAVQVGMLLALADRHIVPDLLVGTSVGAINAAYIAGHPGPQGVAQLAELWTRLRRSDVFPTNPARAMRAVAGRAHSFADPRPLRQLISSRLGYERLEDAAWPVYVVATEVTTGREVVLSRGPAVDAVMASAALPGVFPPVDVEDHTLMDGGVVNNAPISTAIAAGADVVYVLPTGYACALPAAPASAIGMAMHAVTVAIQQRLVSDVRALASTVTLRVAPPLCPLAVSPIDFRHTGELIARGREATRGWLDAGAAGDQARHLALHSHLAADHQSLSQSSRSDRELTCSTGAH